MSNSLLTRQQRDFINALAALLVGWNMQNNAARLYAYLQMKNEPVSLDEIARDLEMSKSNAWAAARTLENVADVRRIAERGTKRVSFIAGDDPGAPLRRQTELLRIMSDLISTRKDQVASGPAHLRMGRLARFHKDLQLAMEAVITPDIRSNAA